MDDATTKIINSLYKVPGWACFTIGAILFVGAALGVWLLIRYRRDFP